MTIEKRPEYFIIRHVGGQASVTADYTGAFELHYDADEKEDFDCWKKEVTHLSTYLDGSYIFVDVVDSYFDESEGHYVIKCQLVDQDGEKYYL